MKKIILSTLIISTAIFANNIDTKIQSESKSHNARINILQEADKCIHNAKTKEDYKNCELKEKEARKAYKANRKKEKQANFLKKKEMIIQKIEEKQKRLEEAKTCIEQAKTHRDFKACRKH